MRLPIDPLIPGILQHLRTANNLVLEAPPGAGKTTRVPAALLDLDDGGVLVLEPRRLAARLAARFVAAERGEPLGGTVGYQVRFEEVAGPATRLRFLTEGVLTRRLLGDPDLKGIACVVLDEFHERHLEGDLALALLRRLQRSRRPDLRMVVMSATLDAAPVADYLGGARVMRAEGRQYPLEIEYTPHSAAPLEDQVAAALARLAAGRAGVIEGPAGVAAGPAGVIEGPAGVIAGPAGVVAAAAGAVAVPGRPAAAPGRVAARPEQGHVLVFLPGAAEIRRAQTACAALADRHGWLLLPLHGDQSPAEQDRAVGPSQRRKVILSTNVAESSITIEGVTAVVDSGVARVASHSPWSGLPVLQVSRISQASANQRAGRAGRTGPGCAIRLYPREDFVRRPAHDPPEIARADLAPVALLLDALGAAGLDSLEWLDRPPAAAVEHAAGLLAQLSATGALAREMARYPLHPRLSRLVVEARRRGVAEDGCTVAALLSAGERLPARQEHATRSDLLVLMESPWDARTAQTVRQVRRMVDPPRQRRRDEEALLISVLAAFPDRVARRRQGAELQLAAGGPAQLAPSSTVTAEEFLVAVEAEDRRDQKAPLVRIASGIQPAWLLDLFPERIRETARVEWNRAAERVESVSALLFDQIAIAESRTAPDPEAAAALLAAKAMEAGLARFADMESVDGFLARVRFAAQHGPVPLPDPEGALRTLAMGLKSFAELEAVARGGVVRALEQQLPAAARRLLDEIAPERIKLPRGRAVVVHYQPDQPPWIASRLQDFFGMRATPAVARGAIPVVVRLLAPNQRPVQMTSDLAGFWQRLYPQVRKELSRRYPRHAWPEDPLAG